MNLSANRFRTRAPSSANSRNYRLADWPLQRVPSSTLRLRYPPTCNLTVPARPAASRPGWETLSSSSLVQTDPQIADSDNSAETAWNRYLTVGLSVRFRAAGKPGTSGRAGGHREPVPRSPARQLSAAPVLGLGPRWCLGLCMDQQPQRTLHWCNQLTSRHVQP